jgi:hypothetical protein
MPKLKVDNAYKSTSELALIKEKSIEASLVSYDLEYVEEKEKKYFSFEDPLSEDRDKEENIEIEDSNNKVFKGYSKKNMTQEECKEEEIVVKEFISLDFIVD